VEQNISATRGRASKTEVEKGANQMTADEISLKMAEQLQVVVEKARELFVDLLDEHARNGKVNAPLLSELDKRSIERLFSEVVYGHIVAEATAIIAFLIYTEVKNDSILSLVAPSFVDGCEGKMEPVTDSVVRKIGDLADLARGILASGSQKSEVVTSLLNDLAGMTRTRPLRASFDAVALSLLGE
jgi:hypothetical protein